MTIFETIRLLKAARLHFFIKTSQPDSVRLTVTLVGERLEIDVFEDGHLEISRFRGDESVEGGEELLQQILKGELEEERGWTVHQGTEVKYKNSPDPRGPMLLSNPMGSTFEVLGMPTHDNHYPWVWVILNETTPRSGIYILPPYVKYCISCSYLDELASRTKIDARVLKLLRNECTP